MRRHALTLAVAVASLVAASPAAAATITRDAAGTLVVTASPGEQNRIVLGASTDDTPGVIAVSDRIPLSVATSGCGTADYLVNCQVTAAGVRVDLGDGNDSYLTSFDFPSNLQVQAQGGAGDDTLTGGDGREVLDGGDGNDTVDGGAGPDTVLGGNGDDTVMGDHFEDPSPDIIDGGPGTDTIQDDWTSRYTDLHPDVAVTLGGGADDGRSGEGDDVRNVERVTVNEGGSLTGTDAPEHLEAFQVLRSVHISGGGGDDELLGSGGDDTIDGGSGNDFIDAGFGNDSIVGGPGRDVIYADRQGGDCGPVWCTEPYGNDTVDVRDGEPDTVDCGWGQDTVYADAIDTVAPDCETVIRSGAPAPTPAPGGSGQPASAGSGHPSTGGQSGGRGSTPASRPGTSHHRARCVVPRLVGLRVRVARHRLALAGCRSRVVGHRHVVRKQSIRRGKSVARRTVVALRT